MVYYNAPTFELPFSFEHSTIKLLVAKLEAGKIPNNRITGDHMIASQAMREVAFWYILSYTGANSFLNDVKRFATSRAQLSENQLASVLNSCLKEAQRKAPAKAPQQPHVAQASPSPAPSSPAPVAVPEAPREPVSPIVIDGLYTVVLNQEGEYRTLRIEEASEATRAKMGLPEGAQIASYLSGSDNDSDYTGFAFVEGGSAKIWKRFKADTKLSEALFTLLKADKEGRADMGQAYALQSGRCWQCNRTLTVPASISRGLGPICAEKLGY